MSSMVHAVVRLAAETVLRPVMLGIALVIPPGAWGQCQVSKLLACDAEPDEYFGWSVAVSADGNTAVMSALWDDEGGPYSGSAYVFVYTGSSWTQEAKLTASDAAPIDYFGESVAVSADGNTAVIGAKWDDDAGSNSGSAYVFVRSGSTWTQEAKLTASDAGADHWFGESAAISADGKTAVIGAPLSEEAGLVSGAAYVFVRFGSVWHQQAKLTASDGDYADKFGISVAVSATGKTAVIGAHFDDNEGGTNAGSAYVFVYTGSTWRQEVKLTAPDAAPFDNFGKSTAVSADGNTAVIGAWHDDNGAQDTGSAYVFVRKDSTWTEQAKLTASDGTVGDQFGNAVTVSADGDKALIGAWEDDNSGNGGSAYLFVRSGSTWTEQAKLTASDTVAVGWFGNSVSMSADGRSGVIGAPASDDKGGPQSGSVYVFDLEPPPGDLDCNGVVGVSDLLILLVNWGPCADCDDCPADLDGDCTVGVSDLLILLGNWG